jgi:hypothetical protein
MTDTVSPTQQAIARPEAAGSARRLSLFDWRTILSENRSPLFGIMRNFRGLMEAARLDTPASLC